MSHGKNDELENFSNHMPATFDDDEILDGGRLQGLDAYEEFDVTSRGKALEQQSKDFVESVIKIYFDAELITDTEMIKALQVTEASTLHTLFAQAEYANHAVSTLMRKINAGMHMELGIYDILIKLQNNAIDITMKVANYRRTILPYLKSVKEEMSSTGTIDIMSRLENDNVPGATLDEHGNTYETTGGQVFRGTKDFNKFLIENMAEAQKELEAAGYVDFETVIETPKPEEAAVEIAIEEVKTNEEDAT